MKAIVCRQYGSPDVLQFEDVERPTPQDNEVLVKVHAASVNAADWHILRADPFIVRLAFGLLRPKFQILGADIAGRVEAVGKDVTEFQPGDEVFGDLSECGWGGFAEYAIATEAALAFKPPNLAFEDAAATPMASVTALQGLRDKGQLQEGERVLINGASGGVGTFAVQIAKALGAKVTAVCSTSKVDLVRSLNADHVIDYTLPGFTLGDERYDLILAANGDLSIFAYKRALTPTGRYVMIGGSKRQMYQTMLLGPWLSMVGGKKLGSLFMQPIKSDLSFIKELLESGTLTPVIDRRYPLDEVPDAIRYLEEGHARGKVVITVQ